MEKQDKYTLNVQKTKILMRLEGLSAILIVVWLLLLIPIIQNAINISQIYDVLQTQFPDQELLSVPQYIARQDLTHQLLWIGCVAFYVVFTVWMFVRFRRIMKDYQGQIAQLSDQIEALQKQHPLTLPEKIDTERAQKYLQKAIDANLIIVTENGLRRVPENCNKTQLVYLLGRIYCQNKTDKLPNDELCKLFNETRLEKINYDIFCNNQGKPAHSETIDQLFDE